VHRPRKSKAGANEAALFWHSMAARRRINSRGCCPYRKPKVGESDDSARNGRSLEIDGTGSRPRSAPQVSDLIDPDGVTTSRLLTLSRCGRELSSCQTAIKGIGVPPAPAFCSTGSLSERKNHETFTQTISATTRGRGRAARRLARRLGASLSDASEVLGRQSKHAVLCRNVGGLFH
jgi:hypothetical protein